MSLIDQIKADQVAALKSGDKFAREKLTTLFAECQRIGKDKNRETTNEECIAKVKSTIINLETLINVTANGEARNVLVNEVNLILKYIPQQLTTQEIREIVIALKLHDSTVKVGDVVKHFKETYPGRFDGGIVSGFARKTMSELTQGE